jgi:uncharacterized small protein (DUF1192 family)
MIPWFQKKKKESGQVGQVLLQILVDELRRRNKRIAELEAELEKAKAK